MGKLLYNCFKKAVNILCRLPEWIRNVQMIPGFSTRLGWERGWRSFMANSKDWRSENVNMIELNCKVVKKWQPSPPPPISTSAPPFQVYPPILAKNFVPPNVILMSLLLTVTHCCSVFFVNLEHVNDRWNTLLPSSKSIHFRVWSRNPVT